MADITTLTEDTAPGSDSLIYTVDAPATTPADRKATIGNLFAAHNLSAFAATTSAQLAGVISDETGTGNLVFATSPTLVTPALGTPASGVLTNTTGYAAADLTASQVTDFSTAADARIALAVLDDLADVTETTITTGDLLRWNGSAWVNYADSNFGSASDVSSNTTHRTSDGSDHTFIDQSVVSGASPTFTGTNITGVPAASILAGTFGTGAYTFDSILTIDFAGGGSLLRLGDSSEGVDDKNWDIQHGVATGGLFRIRAMNDALSSGNNALTIARSGTTIGAWVLAGTTFDFSAGSLSNITTLTATTLAGTLSTATQNSVTTMTGLASVGTITSGTWQGTAIDSAYIDQTLSVSTLTASGEVSAATDFRLANAYSRVADLDAGGGWGGGYNFYIDVSNPKHNSTGALSGVHFRSDGTIGLFANSSQAADTAASEKVTIAADGGVTLTSTLSGITTLTATTLVGAHTLTTAAQPNVTSVGTLTGLTVSGALDLAANGDVLTFTDTGNECRIVWDATGANAALVGNESMYVLIDANNDQTTRGFLVGHNATTPGAATVLFKVLEDGITTVNEDLALTTGSITSASGAISFGDENLSTTGTGAFGTTTITSTAFNAGLKVIGSATTGSGVTLQSTDTGGREFQVFATGSISTPGLGLAIYDDTSNAYRMFVDASGNFDFYSGTITTTGAISGGAGSSFGLAGTEGTLHILTASAGAVTAHTWGDDLVIENSTYAGLSILTPNTVIGSIFFGDPEDADNGRIQYDHSDQSLSLTTNTVAALTLDSSQNATFAGDVYVDSGDLRIGTTSASAAGGEPLRVYGDSDSAFVLANFHNNSTGGSAQSLLHITTGDTGTTISDGALIGLDAANGVVVWNSESTYTRFATANTERLRIASDAYAIGIGTTDVESWSSSYGAIEFGGGAAIMAANSGTNGEMYLLSNAYYDGSWKYKATNEAVRQGFYDGFLNWSTAASGTIDTAITWSEKMRLNNSGQLLIGTTSATSHANEVLRVLGSTGSSGAFLNIHGADSEGSRLQFTNDTTGTTSNDGFDVGIDGSENGIILHRDANPVLFYTAATERLRIASDCAAIALGHTDAESWSSSYGAIEFGRSAIMGNVSSRSLFMMSGAYFDGAWKHKAGSEAAVMFDMGATAAGAMAWSTHGGGTIDASFSWSEKMRLTNDGELILGTTAAASTELLRVNGSVYMDGATEDLHIKDSGSTSATEQDWIEVTVGGNTGYIRVYATK